MRLNRLGTIGLVAALLAAGGAAAQQRAAEGTLVYRARIALPAGAMAVVEARDADGTLVAEARAASAGRQVPLPFTLALPAGRDLSLRAAILDGGRPLWLGGPLAVAAGDAPVELGDIVLGPVPESGIAHVFRCGADELRLTLLGGAAILAARGALTPVVEVPAASGMRLEAQGDPATFFWSKGAGAMAGLGAGPLEGCVAGVPRAEPPLRARGNEPGWHFEIDAGHIVLVSDYGASRREAALPPPAIDGQDIVYRLEDPAAEIRITPGICHDDATGMPYGNGATVEAGGRLLRGCAGAALDLLTGSGWVAEDIAGAGLIDSSHLTLQFDGTADAGRVSGQGGCNRYTGGFTLSGEGLRFGPAASTMMACAEALMNQEQAFFAALAGVAGFDIDETGALLLKGVDGRVLVRARRG